MLIVDAHLDLAYNVARGRDPRMPAKDQPSVKGEIATVGLPDLSAGGVELICATIFCIPQFYRVGGYINAEEARTQAIKQLEWYRGCVGHGLLRWVRNPGELRSDSAALGAILLMEGADAIRSPADVQEWFDAGLRIVGLAWRKNRMAGGTTAPGPISDEGRALIPEFDRLGIIHDLSHLSDESFWQLLDVTTGPMIASHSNCRTLVAPCPDPERHLTDEMIRAIIARDGVIGINFYDEFLVPPDVLKQRRVTLRDVIAHIRHICDLAGNADHVALGTDMDGGVGRDQIPVEIQTSADLPKLAEALTGAGFSDQVVQQIMGENWLRFFRQHLPKADSGTF